VLLLRLERTVKGTDTDRKGTNNGTKGTDTDTKGMNNHTSVIIHTAMVIYLLAPFV
jgi:hypothetical protein